MKIIIAGGRDFNDYDTLQSYCDSMLANQETVEIVSGTAKGADKLGERYAKDRGHKLTLFPADWNNLGKSAGYIRNKQMAEYADALIAFWDKRSKGTKHMIDLATKMGLKIRIVNYSTCKS